MTIICVDRNTIAADGLSVCGGIITSLSRQKIRVVNRCIYAMYGTVLFFEPAIDWHQAGAKPAEVPKADKDNNWHLVVINQSGLAVYNWDAPYPDTFDPPWALGSNAELAHGLMVAGKSAEEAVKIICEKTIYAGGEIQKVNIAEALGQLREAAE